MDSILTEDSILLLNFLFSRSKASDAIIGIIYCQFRLVCENADASQHSLIFYHFLF